MKLLVTGATGFIGSHFLRLAVPAGHHVRALRRPGSVPRIALDESPSWVEQGLDEVAEADLAGCEAVVHLAAHSANAPYDTFEACLHWNVQVALRFLERCRVAGVSRFIVAGSCFEYGRSAERYERVPVNAPLEPVGSYPSSKAAATVAAIGWAQQHGVALSVLRPFQVFGEGEARTRLWPALRAAAAAGADFPMSRGDQVRDFIPVADVAGEFLRELQRPSLAGVPQIRNVGTGNGRTILEFAEEWWRHWNAKGNLLPGAFPTRASDVRRCVALP